LRFLDRTDDHVPKPCSFLPPKGLYAHNPLGSRIVYHLEVCSHLDECSDLLKPEYKHMSPHLSLESICGSINKHLKKTTHSTSSSYLVSFETGYVDKKISSQTPFQSLILWLSSVLLQQKQ
jgi:hypothetical protein